MKGANSLSCPIRRSWYSCVDKINLLYVITKLELGGAQKQLLSLIQGLDRTRYNIFLFTAREGILMDEALAAPGLRVYRSRFMERAVNPFFDIPAFFELVCFIRREKIEIVHTHSSKAGILGRFAAAAAGVQKVYHTVHGWPFHDFQFPLARWFFVFLERCAAAVTTRIIVVSTHDKKRGLTYRICGEGRYSLVRYGIDAAAFEEARPAVRKSLGIPEGAPVVAMVSCFKPQKAVRDFIAVARDVCAVRSDAVFMIAGDGIQRRAIGKMIEAYGLKGRIILLGWRRDIAELLASCDVFMLTSLWEGMPISVIEAMAASRSVIVTDTGGVRELVKDGDTGFLVPCRDTDAMSRKLLTLLHDPTMRARIGKKAHDSLQDHYSTRRMAQETQLLYCTAAVQPAVNSRKEHPWDRLT